MLGSLHGMGADQVLEMQVVTADGQFLTASPTENTDLFWAIRGGGGSTFGIVTSMIVKAFKDVETTVGTLGWSVQGNNISNDTFWRGVSSYFSYFKGFTEQGLSSEWYITQTNGNPTFSVAPFFAPGKTLEETQIIAAPWLADMKSLGITLSVTWSHFPSYWTALKDVYDPTTVSLAGYFGGYASRIWPGENFDKNEKLDVTVAAIRQTAEAGHMFVGYMYAPTLQAGAPVGPNGNAVHPAWRQALVFTIVFVQWPPSATAEEQLQIRQDFATEGMKPIRDVTPGAGSYMNEGDRLEPDLQQSFYGPNYEELLAVKRKFDPDDVFWAATAVGSEGWAVRSVDGLPNENGHLCRVTE
jgi:FAD/FMN-containing dehydrogenase